MPKCDFNKVASNFTEIALKHGCSPVNLLHLFLRTALYRCFCKCTVCEPDILPNGKLLTLRSVLSYYFYLRNNPDYYEKSVDNDVLLI